MDAGTIAADPGFPTGVAGCSTGPPSLVGITLALHKNRGVGFQPAGKVVGSADYCSSTNDTVRGACRRPNRRSLTLQWQAGSLPHDGMSATVGIIHSTSKEGSHD